MGALTNALSIHGALWYEMNNRAGPVVNQIRNDAHIQLKQKNQFPSRSE